MCVIFDAKFGDVCALVKHMSDVGTSHVFNHKKWDIYSYIMTKCCTRSYYVLCVVRATYFVYSIFDLVGYEIIPISLNQQYFDIII